MYIARDDNSLLLKNKTKRLNMVSVRPLPPALAEKARAELGETPEALTAGIQHLKDWIHSQPHLRARTDDQWLAAFLRGCKFRLEQAKAKLDLYYSLKTTAPDLYTLRYNDPKVCEIIERGTIVMLPRTRTPDSPRVTMLRIGTCNTKEHTVLEVMAVFNFLNQINFIEDDNFTVAGVINIIDLRNSVFAHYTQASIKQIRNIISAHQDALPVRIKQAHFIGAPYMFYALMNIIKIFLSEKVKNRFHMHNDIDTLHEFVPPELLPEEYGGTGPTLREIKDHWKQKVVDYHGFYEEDLQFQTDEALRVKEGKKNKTNLNID
ncbi:clavesin-2-like [Aricia agestis]|uniref:clavesin-2-like n=1 Tax=Aricia agestis TaxID=91739 RepID=UPI001C207A86|nr:clavesin-2-like [Aricia agestis]